jgi:hypothetical protein
MEQDFCDAAVRRVSPTSRMNVASIVPFLVPAHAAVRANAGDLLASMTSSGQGLPRNDRALLRRQCRLSRADPSRIYVKNEPEVRCRSEL